MTEMDQPPKTSDQIDVTTDTDKKAQLQDLITRAAAKDAAKDHNAASELYSQATELQAELNGEMSPDNADLLYAYGKSLYNVAVSKSDVLGTKVAGEQPQSSGAVPAAKSSSAAGSGSATGGSLVKDAISSSMGQTASTSKKSAGVELDSAPSKPFFQFTGDENFVDSDEEDDEGGDGENGDGPDGQEEEEEEDDFANAFEVLDLARVLYLKRLEAAEEASADKGKGKSGAATTATDAQLPADLKHIKERLADTYDLQAEISLEGERFSDAVTDLRTALDLRNTLFPFEDPSVAECHYKLSLALEFASVQQHGEGDEDVDEDREGQEKTVDQEMRNEAATQMERAIESCKARMASEQKKLETEDLDEDKKIATQRRISNSKEIIADMEQRVSSFCLFPSVFYSSFSTLSSLFIFIFILVSSHIKLLIANLLSLSPQLIDLRRSPVSLEQKERENEAMLKGILGQIVGQSATDQQARLDAVSKEANDLSSLVRRKPAPTASAATQSSSTGSSSSKRPAEDVSADNESKRARVDGEA
ncbi:hypothetical protein POX_h09562 [Penicillium oxalicum]|uniref:hypothetical protein n=1 Tax=Penicillium oxalicum TaxID=69781 RepID=UPI0020B6CBBD|nr:hypothetical protein POX_h09562 [Penicillium oxalicum]KAI2785802.1 hypothetical protein POX_h09562 [Penicillium oxalicum]